MPLFYDTANIYRKRDPERRESHRSGVIE